MRNVLGLCMLIVPMAAATGDSVYKWVDERGVTHYSQTPPAGRRPAGKLELEPTPAPANGAPAGGEKWREEAAAFQRRWEARQAAEEAERERRAEAAANRRARCEQARAELARLMATRPALQAKPGLRPAFPGYPVYRSYSDERDEVEVMNNAERTAGIDRAEKDIDQWCG